MAHMEPSFISKIEIVFYFYYFTFFWEAETYHPSELLYSFIKLKYIFDKRQVYAEERLEHENFDEAWLWKEIFDSLSVACEWSGDWYDIKIYTFQVFTMSDRYPFWLPFSSVTTNVNSRLLGTFVSTYINSIDVFVCIHLLTHQNSCNKYYVKWKDEFLICLDSYNKLLKIIIIILFLSP